MDFSSITQPTKEDHILNLFLTMHPDIIENVQVVSGISDQEATLAPACVTF